MAQTELFSPTVPSMPPGLLAQAGEHEHLPPKAEGAYRTIREVSEELDVPQHVLRFWESRFPQIKPSRMRGSRRYYRPEDIETLKTIKTLLYAKGYTIKGAKKVVSGKAEMPAFVTAAAPAPMPAPKQAAPRAPATPRVDIPTVVDELRMLKSMLSGLLPEHA